MLLGSTQVYKCPNCDMFHLHPTVLSANGFGAKYYSDGRVEGLGLPRVTSITTCNKCGNLFWLDEKDRYDEFEDDYNFGDPGEKNKSEYYFENYKWTTFPDLDLFKRAIENKMFRNDKDEKYLRTWYHWKINEEVSDPSEYDNPFWKENALRLIEFLDNNSQKSLLFISELYRNMGDFNQSLDTLDWVTDPSFSAQAFQLFKKCINEERLVFKFEYF